MRHPTYPHCNRHGVYYFRVRTLAVLRLRQPPDLRCLGLDHETFAGCCPLALPGLASYPVLVHRLAVSLHASSPRLVTPHAVALRFIRRGQLMGGLTSPRSRPCWAHNKNGLPEGKPLSCLVVGVRNWSWQHRRNNSLSCPSSSTWVIASRAGRSRRRNPPHSYAIGPMASGARSSHGGMWRISRPAASGALSSDSMLCELEPESVWIISVGVQERNLL